MNKSSSVTFNQHVINLRKHKQKMSSACYWFGQSLFICHHSEADVFFGCFFSVKCRSDCNILEEIFFILAFRTTFLQTYFRTCSSILQELPAVLKTVAVLQKCYAVLSNCNSSVNISRS